MTVDSHRIHNEMAPRFGLKPFWPSDVCENDKYERLREFRQAAYKVWEPIVRDVVEKAADDEPEGPEFDELGLLHACDLALFRSGVRVDRAGAGVKKLQAAKESVVSTIRDAANAYQPEG